MKPDDPNVKPVHGGGIEWTIKDGIPYHVPTLMKEVKDMVTKARTERPPIDLAALTPLARGVAADIRV